MTEPRSGSSDSGREQVAKFAIGQVVHHVRFDYRGVIVDIDATFGGSEEWYEQMALSRPPRDRPWYHVLVDGADHMTYVAERHLEIDPSGGPIRHPALGRYFDTFDAGIYRRAAPMN